MTPDQAAAEMLSHLGRKESHHIIQLPGGRNNTVWRVICGNDSFLLKNYFWSESDSRDRLGQEWAFLEFLESIGSRKSPAPLAKIPAARFALLEFIAGAPPVTIDEDDIEDAAIFFTTINAHRHLETNLPPVSEAAFSIDAHLAATARRVEMLNQIQPSTPDHNAAIAFVESTLQPLWEIIRHRIARLPTATRSAFLPDSRRCLSPSDFGFHNALRQPDGTLRYLDFEYAGWDDPAKTLIDFINQPDRILPDPLATHFLEKTIPLFPDSTELRDRIEVLTPLYQLKWACICLNTFLPGRPSDPARPLETQLIRARTMATRAAQA